MPDRNSRVVQVDVAVQTRVFSWSATWPSRVLRVSRVNSERLCADSDTESSLSGSLSICALARRNTADISSTAKGFTVGINHARENGRRERRNSSDPDLRTVSSVLSICIVSSMSLYRTNPPAMHPYVIRTGALAYGQGSPIYGLQHPVHERSLSTEFVNLT